MPSKQEIIDERKANLPLPDQPPQASDWQSADARNVNVGSGSIPSKIASGSLREPATGGSAVREDGAESHVDDLNVGRTAKDGLKGIPNDAVTRDKKNAAGLEDTTGKDYGYPHRSDPSSGLK